MVLFFFVWGAHANIAVHLLNAEIALYAKANGFLVLLRK